MEYPKLRSTIEIFPAEVSDQRVLCLRDTLNFTDKVVFLPMEAYYILRLFDGRHSFLDIQAEFMRALGTLLYKEEIQELAKQLDENLFLDSELFQAHRDKVLTEFRASPLRRAALAGKSYPAEADKLTSELDRYFAPPEGPGDGIVSGSGDILKGAVMPHIDYPRGGHTYAWPYREVMSRLPADVYVILGTAHVATSAPYVLTAKDFETPLGTLKADREMIQALSEKCGPDVFSDELAHLGEHSVELQAVYLKHALGDKRDATIVPVLCGSFHQYVAEGASPEKDPRVEKFISALRDCTASSPRRVCVIASADLSHMGPRFGDQEAITSVHLKLMESQDMEMLRSVEAGDAEGLFHHIARDKDRRRVCGFPAIYTMLKVINPSRGKFLKYSQWPDENATVTFAGMVFTG